MTGAGWTALVLASSVDLTLGALAVGPLSPWIFGLAHPMLVGATLTILGRAARSGDAPALPAWVAAAFGPAATLIAMALPSSSRSQPTLLAVPSGIGKEAAEPISLQRVLDARVRLPEPHALGSLGVTLRHGSLAERQAAVETVVRSFEPRLSPIIAAALADTDQTIRALAASASAQVVHDLTRQRRDLERAVQTEPAAAARLRHLLDDHGRHNVLLSAGVRARLISEAAALAQPACQTATLRNTCAALLRARDFEGLARRCAEADALALDEDDCLASVVAYWGRAAPA